MIPPTYNANLQILQTRDAVVIRHEMMHDVRITRSTAVRIPDRTSSIWRGFARPL